MKLSVRPGLLRESLRHSASGPVTRSAQAACKTAVLAFVVGLAACAGPPIGELDELSRTARHDEALRLAERAARDHPADLELRAAVARARDRAAGFWLSRAELALAQGRVDEAAVALEQAQRAEPQRAGLASLAMRVENARQRPSAAERPGRAPAAAAAAASPPALGAAFQKTVALEFREAPVRQVFEALARSSGVNFVFDKDVRGDARITVFLRAVTLDEAMRVILATQQLDRKLLNDSTVLIYPNTPAKQREHQELVTRSLYLANADPKQVLAMVRTLTKTRDVHVDERLNALVVRDTPEVVRQVEQLVANLDLAEPEVMLAVEVMEVASDRLEELGIDWPEAIGFGVPGSATTVPIGGGGFRGLVANPALAATLRGNVGSTNLLANPTIRARNREKAKVQIGEKLPVFTTTATANVGVSTTVTYLDVGLKLDVEPTVALDDEVVIKVALEVSNLLREVSGPQGALAYQVGTRMTSTSLRLKDGHTQVLAGLINDEDRQRATGLPGLSRLPLVGRLFGVRSDTRNKTEIVMLITPRIVRQIEPPPAAALPLPSGVDALPGAPTLRLREGARAGVAAGRGAAGGAAAAPVPDPSSAAEAPPAGGLQLAASAQARVGRTVSITLANRSDRPARGELVYDAAHLQPASAAAGADAAGRWPFELAPNAEAVLVMRVLPAAAGQSVAVSVLADAPVQGQAQWQVPAAPAGAP